MQAYRREKDAPGSASRLSPVKWSRSNPPAGRPRLCDRSKAGLSECALMTALRRVKRAQTLQIRGLLMAPLPKAAVAAASRITSNILTWDAKVHAIIGGQALKLIGNDRRTSVCIKAHQIILFVTKYQAYKGYHWAGGFHQPKSLEVYANNPYFLVESMIAPCSMRFEPSLYTLPRTLQVDPNLWCSIIIIQPLLSANSRAPSSGGQELSIPPPFHIFSTALAPSL